MPPGSGLGFMCSLGYSPGWKLPGITESVSQFGELSASMMCFYEISWQFPPSYGTVMMIQATTRNLEPALSVLGPRRLCWSLNVQPAWPSEPLSFGE
jgi:hypothetical protein